MKYIEPKFSLAVANSATNQKDWDRAFMGSNEFRLKYGEDTGVCGVSVAPKGWTCSRSKFHGGPCAAHPITNGYLKGVDD